MDRERLLAKVGFKRRLGRRVRRAAWRLRQAENEFTWAIASARDAGLPVRAVAAEAGKSPSRIQQITTGAGAPDVLEAALAELRTAGWPAPEDPGGSDDEELAGRASVGARLADEAAWVLACADWADQLGQDRHPVVNLRPDADDASYRLVIDLPRVAAVLRRIAYDVDELARARTVDDLGQAAVAADAGAERRRRLAEEDMGFARFRREFFERHRRSRWYADRHPRTTDADVWRAWQHELSERGEPHSDPWGFNPFER